MMVISSKYWNLSMEGRNGQHTLTADLGPNT
jgi:hypothetical protein